MSLNGGNSHDGLFHGHFKSLKVADFPGSTMEYLGKSLVLSNHFFSRGVNGKKGISYLAPSLSYPRADKILYWTMATFEKSAHSI